MKCLIFFVLIFFAPLLLADQFSVQPQGLFGPKRTLVDAWFFNEGVGTVARSGVGGSSADLLSGPTWITGLHASALSFATTNSRAEIRNESNFDFLTLTSTWTLVLVYKATSLLKGILFAKTGTFNSSAGFYIQAESDATGDLAFNHILGGAPQKYVTSVIPVSQAAGGKWRVLIFDYCSNGPGATSTSLRIFLDGKRLPTTITFSDPRIGDITNNNLAVISGWDDGTSTSFNGMLDMVAICRGDGQKPITENDAKTIMDRVLGR